MTTNRYEHFKSNLQLTISFKDNILSIHVLDHIGCLTFSNDFSNDCLGFGKLLTTKMIYDMLTNYFEEDSDKIELTFSHKAKSLVLDIEYKTDIFTLPICLTLNQHEMSKESCDKLVLNRQIHKLETKIIKLTDYITSLHKFIDCAPSVSFNKEHLFVPRKIACLFLGEVSLQYHASDNFLQDLTIKPTIVERRSRDISFNNLHRFMGVDKFPRESDTNYYFSSAAVGTGRNIDPITHHHQNSLLIKSSWDLSKLHDLIGLKYLAIDCLATDNKDLKWIPTTVEYLYLIDPQFTTIPDLCELTNLKKMVIEGRTKSLLKDGMEQVRIFKMIHSKFVFEKTGDQKEITA